MMISWPLCPAGSLGRRRSSLGLVVTFWPRLGGGGASLDATRHARPGRKLAAAKNNEPLELPLAGAAPSDTYAPMQMGPNLALGGPHGQMDCSPETVWRSKTRRKTNTAPRGRVLHSPRARAEFARGRGARGLPHNTNLVWLAACDQGGPRARGGGCAAGKHWLVLALGCRSARLSSGCSWLLFQGGL